MFTELNSVENFVRDILCGPVPAQDQVAEPRSEYLVGKAQSWKGLGWEFIHGQLPSTPIQ
jgi:hypothetical protein